MLEHRTWPGAWAGERVLVLSPTPTHPQDFGNRKRVFRVCSRLAEEGAHITFVHYPAEMEWRRTSPRAAERAMRAAWPEYYAVPPSRDLHSAPAGSHHQIDEWWDDAIGNLLRWLFSVQSFDAFIVNYSWLSKAFEFAPPPVIKILDTHDKVSGRRELLESHGLEPEYFYTTAEQEMIALNRADIVWAIKDEERADFERMTRVPVFTLPHTDSAHEIARPAPDAEGHLRVGFLAARNSINRTSITEFAKVALPIFQEWFAPVKLVVGGSVCDLLEEFDNPFVELRGHVHDVGEFYRSVDCVAVPMQFSTGLKIKTGEAISASLPVAATAHAFEGYAPVDPLHTCADYEVLARALVDLSFAPRERLDELALASIQSRAKTAALVDETLARTRVLIRERQASIVIAVDSRAFVYDSIFNQVLLSILSYLRYLGDITVLVTRGSVDDVLQGGRTRDQLRRVVVADTLGNAVENRSRLFGMDVEVARVEEFLQQKCAKVLVADALHPAFFADTCASMAVFWRAEVIALSEGRGNFALPKLSCRRSFVVALQGSTAVAALRSRAGASLVQAPCFYRPDGLARGLQHRNGRKGVVLLGSPGSTAVRLALAMAEAWKIDAHVVAPVGESTDLPHARSGILCTSAVKFADDLAARARSLPRFAIAFGKGGLGLQLCRELLERLGVPVVTTGSVRWQGGLQSSTLPYAVATEFELQQVFRAFAIDPETAKHPAFDRATKALNTEDNGWAFIWAFCKRAFDTQYAEFA